MSEATVTEMSQQLKLVEINDDENKRLLEESNEELCVVCFKELEIFSIGDCDHPVCFECSTRMRVLCGQNECPICRQSLSKVIFTNEKKTYKYLEMYSRSEYYSKKYKIAFANLAIQKAFYTLLDHPCKICNQTFQTFNSLKDHVRREHELFFCDICTENLRIFSFERKCYSRQELAMHRRKGDPASAHRGHPLCEYCDCRYLDRDELFRHLRREHFFCHFCDADGSNQFYGDYDSLREHFRNEHYLCEEGECATEQFTGVFRTDIDLRAHIANIHGKCFNKLQAKQARTLQLEITLGPRGRSDHHHHPGANLRKRNENGHHQLDNDFEQCIAQPPRVIDAKNEQEFPSLAGTGANSSSANALVNHSNMLRRSTQSGLARTKENFPALGGANSFDSGGVESAGIEQNKSNGISASAILKHKNSNNEKPQQQHTANSMVIHVSNRPVSKPAQNQNDFPALPFKAQKKTRMNEDLSLPPRIDALNKLPTRHRNLVDNNYVSVAKPTTSKLHLIQEDQKELEYKNKPFLTFKAQKKAKINEDLSLPPRIDAFDKLPTRHRNLVDNNYVSVANSATSKLHLIQEEQKELEFKNKQNTDIALNKSDFPALAFKSVPNLSQPTWIKPKEPKKSKVALAPNLRIFEQKTNERLLPNKYHNHSETNNKNNKKGPNKTENSVGNAIKPTKSNDKLNPRNTKQKNSENCTAAKPIKSINENKVAKNDINNKIFNQSNEIAPPPGFVNATSNTNKVPPGFQKIQLNSIAKPVNDLTFESSLGAKYSVLPFYTYIPPPNNMDRNKELITHFVLALSNCADAVKEFKFISQKFREGVYKPDAYYEHCQAALGNKFDDLFPELLALLPDINKQQELYLVHMQHLSISKKKPKQYQKLEVCSICKQVVKNLDSQAHGKLHNLDLNFPSLSKK